VANSSNVEIPVVPEPENSLLSENQDDSFFDF
jgi:hypothetical protein